MIPTLQLGGLGRAAKLAAAGYTPRNAARVYRNSTQSYTTASGFVALSWNTEVRDDDTYWDAGSPTRLTIPGADYDGLFFVASSYDRTSTAGGSSSQTTLRVDGSATFGKCFTFKQTSEDVHLQTYGIGYLSSGSYVEAMISESWNMTLPANVIQAGVAGIGTSTLLAAMVSNAGNQNISATTETALTFATENLDVGACFSSGANTRITVPTGGAGWWLAHGICEWQVVSGGHRRSTIREGGSTIIARESVNPNSGGGMVPISQVVALAYLDDTDYLEHVVYSTAGTLTTANKKFNAVRVATEDGARVSRSTSQSIATGPTAIQFDTEEKNTDGIYDSGSNTRLTVQSGKAGWYLITGGGQWSALTNGRRMFNIKLNGTTVLQTNARWAPSAHNDPYILVADVYYLNAGDYVELMAEASTTVSVAAGAHFSMVRMPYA